MKRNHPFATGPRHGFTAMRRRAFTLLEVMISLGIFGILAAAVCSQLIESLAISKRTARNLEHCRTTREIVDRLSSDMRSGDKLTLYPSFEDRSKELQDSESGNYLVIQTLSTTGAITRTIGYYLEKSISGTSWQVYRHDSADGILAPDTLPASSTAGTHRALSRATDLPDSGVLFRRIRQKGIALRASFGTPETNRLGHPEFVQCVLAARS